MIFILFYLFKNYFKIKIIWKLLRENIFQTWKLFFHISMRMYIQLHNFFLFILLLEYWKKGIILWHNINILCKKWNIYEIILSRFHKITRYIFMSDYAVNSHRFEICLTQGELSDRFNNSKQENLSSLWVDSSDIAW